MDTKWSDLPKWDAKGRWARPIPPVQFSEDWKENNRRIQARLNDELGLWGNLRWMFRWAVFFAALFLWGYVLGV